MATEAMRIVASVPELRLTNIVFHDKQDHWTSRLQREARALQCEAVKSLKFSQIETVDRLKAGAPDLILSVNNHDIIRANLLAVPPDGIINFHNGPLPQYRGVHIPSWAIINGETSHTVTWHFVDEGVDTGPVVLTAPLKIEDNETAISLVIKCIDMGLVILPNLLDLYINGKIHPVRQRGSGRYYSMKDTPDDGRIDLSWSRSRISSLVRGLTFHPYQNTFVYPRITIGDRWYGVGRAEPVDECSGDLPEGAGRIVDVSHNSLLVRAADGLMRFSFLTDENGEQVSEDEVREQVLVSLAA